MFKILQARLQQYICWELPDVQAGFWRGRETRDQISNIWRIMGKTRELKKKSISASLNMLKPLTVWITASCGKFYMQVKKQQLEQTWNNGLVQNWESSMIRLYIVTLLLNLYWDFSSVIQSCPTLCNPMECSIPGLPVHQKLPEFTQTHVH